MACAQVAPEPLGQDIDAEKRVEVKAGTFVVFADEVAASEAVWFDALEAVVPGGLRRTTTSRYRDNGFAFYIGEARKHPSFRERRQRRWLDDVPAVGVQGYRLLIDKRGIIIAGTDEAGVINGVTSLLQLFDADGSLPQAQIRDEPEIPIRAIRLRIQPDAEIIRSLTQAKCNFAIIDSPDWWSPRKAAMESWRATFAELRAVGIEPVPLIDPLSQAGATFDQTPRSIHTKIAIDQIVLSSETWTTLSHPNIVGLMSMPIRVRSTGKTFTAGRDYRIAPGDTAYPFRLNNTPWRIRRVADGAIPDSEMVDVLYAYATPDAQSATEYEKKVHLTVDRVVRDLKPRYLHIGHDDSNTSADDLRWVTADRNPSDPFAILLKIMIDAASEANSELKLIANANTFRGRHSKHRIDLLPKDALLEVSTPYGPPPVDTAVAPDFAWATALGRPLIVQVPASPIAALPWCEAAARMQAVNGIITDHADVISAAWAPRRSSLPWPRVLNAYFGSGLWNPGSIEAFTTLVARANGQSVRGVSPEEELIAFRGWFEQNRDRIPKESATFVEGHYKRILEWVRLEAEFRRGDGRNTLRDLIDLVQRHASATPDYPENRRSTIVHTVDSAKRFVPSNILFGTPVLPYRAINLPGSHIVLEVQARPEYTDRQVSTEVRFDLLESPGPIIRIDFDTLDPARISINRSTDGETFNTVQQWESSRAKPPLLVQRPFSATAISVSVEGNPPVLRDPRVFALKDIPAAICSQTDAAPVLDGNFRESAWRPEAQINGFVETTQHQFAAAATTIRLTYTRDALYLGVYAREPRMDTLVANITGRDGPVWTDEAIDIRIGIGNDAFIFATNPNAATFESRNGDAQWNAEWTVRTRRYATGWTAEIAIPFEALGKQPRAGDDWQFDAVRYRRNVEQSTSHWAYHPDTTNSRAPGRLIFN